MKKLLLFLVLNFAYYNLTAQTTLIPDSNFEQALIDLNIDSDGTLNGQVLTADINTVTDLDVSNKSILNAKGIEAFTSLINLNMSNNFLYNAINFSALTQLEILNLTDNGSYGLSGETINISGCSALKNLNIEHCNMLTIDISNNTNLEVFHAPNNNFASINLLSNTNLIYISLDGNNLTSVSISPNSILEHLNLTNNNIIGLDLSTSTALERIYLTNNNLSSLNVKNGTNTIITNFKASGNSNLACIQVDDANFSTNNWTDIDATTVFSEGDCALTYIPDDNFEQALIDAGIVTNTIIDNYVLTSEIADESYLNIAGKNISDLTGIEDFVALVDFVCSNNSLTGLDMTGNTALQSLRCNGNSLTSLDISQNSNLNILRAYNTDLSEIDASNNPTLVTIYAQNNPNLNVLNLQNGNNSNLNGSNFQANNNPNLTCIQVDDAVYSTGNWTTIDSQSFFSTLSCDVTYVPDDNFEQALIDLGHDDVLNDYVVTSNISSLTDIDLRFQGIVDMTGIEDFTALTQLQIQANNTIQGHLDLSNNTNLVHVYCDRNLITSIDVSNLTNLRTLRAYQNNIASIDVSTNTQLDFLDLSDNQLQSVDVTDNMLLTRLLVNNNPNIDELNIKNGTNANITEFSATGNTNLSCIEVDDAAASYLTTLPWAKDASANFNENCHFDETYVPDDNFENYLETHNTSGIVVPLGDPTSMGNGIANDDYVLTNTINTLTNLNVSNTGITDATGLEAFVSLESLNIKNNALTVLNISSNLTLLTLNCENNNLTSLDVSTNTALTGLTFADNGLTSIDLSNNTQLTSINCDHNNLTTLDLSTNTALSVLNCVSNELTTLDISANPALEILRCSFNALATIDLESNVALRVLIAYATAITSLDLNSNTNLEDVRLSNNPTLSALNLKNGNNTNITTFLATTIPNLTCIQVDDAVYSTNNWTSIDVLASFSEFCPEFYTYVPDDAFEQALIDLGHDDVLDDYVLTNTINTLTSLDVSNQGIADATGLEAFVALESLSISDNVLTTLDLSTNIALVTVFCRNSNLATINITNNTLLAELYCEDNNLTALDISGNTALVVLRAETNNLTSIDLSNNTQLFIISFENNALTSLNLSNNLDVFYLNGNGNAFTLLDLSHNVDLQAVELNNCANFSALNIKSGNNTNNNQFSAVNNPNLTCVEVDDAVYSTNNWTSIDAQTSFSEDCDYFTYVPDDNFEQALIDLGYDDVLDDYVLTNTISQITELIVVYKSISDATGIEDFVSLDRLSIFNNNLSSLDVSNNILLTHLSASNNNISDINVSENTLLEEIRLSNNNLSSMDVSTNILLERLYLNENSLTELNLSTNINLSSLVLNDNNISSLDLSTNELLNDLDIRVNALMALDVSSNPLINALYLNDNYLQELDLSANTALRYLYVNDNNLSSLNLNNNNNTLIQTFRVLNNPNLTCIQVDDAVYSTTNWTDIDAQTSFSNFCIDLYTYVPDDNFEQALIDLNYDDVLDDYVLTTNINTLTSINLSNKGIADATGIEAFVALTSLTINNNNLSTIDVSNNTQLEFLNIRYNNLTAINVSANTLLDVLYARNNLLSSIDANTQLTHLELANNNLTAINVSNLLLLEELKVSLNTINTIDVTNNTALEVLHLESCGLSSIDLTANNNLSEFYIHNNSLTTLSVSNMPNLVDINASDNNITTIDYSNNLLLESIYVYNNNLTGLDISQNPEVRQLEVYNNNLESLNVQNGTNVNFNRMHATGNPNLTCIQVDDENGAYLTATSGPTELKWQKDITASFSNFCGDPVLLSAKVFLQGAAINPNSGEESLMRDDLRIMEATPTTSPYDSSTCDASIFTITGNDAIVDWVWVELRDAIDNTSIVSAQSALLQRDGDVVGVDGVSPLSCNATEDSYYVVVNHRNHLGVMSANTVALSGTTTVLDFTDANNQITYGLDAQTSFGMPLDMVGMWAGNVGSDTSVKFSGSGNDTTVIKDTILSESGNTTNSNLYTYSGYDNADVDMNGNIRFQGSGNDTNTIKDIILSHPDNQSSPSNLFTIEEQLPEN